MDEDPLSSSQSPLRLEGVSRGEVRHRYSRRLVVAQRGRFGYHEWSRDVGPGGERTHLERHDRIANRESLILL